MEANIIVRWFSGLANADESGALLRLAEVAQEMIDLGASEIIITPVAEIENLD